MSSVVAPKLRPSLRLKAPGLDFERTLWDQGNDRVVGIDEVGRGAWAGPLTIVAAVVPKGRRVYKIRDSKMLTESEREAMFGRVAEWCDDWAIGHASAEECDQLGMSEAQRLAASRAIGGLNHRPDHVLVDGNWDFVGGATKIVKGDQKSLSIAAASILAKVTRDRLMRVMADTYPAYNFEANKGYPCPVHKAALQVAGPSPAHRRSWVFMDHLMWSGLERFDRGEPQLPFEG